MIITYARKLAIKVEKEEKVNWKGVLIPGNRNDTLEAYNNRIQDYISNQNTPQEYTNTYQNEQGNFVGDDVPNLKCEIEELKNRIDKKILDIHTAMVISANENLSQPKITERTFNLSVETIEIKEERQKLVNQGKWRKQRN